MPRLSPHAFTALAALAAASTSAGQQLTVRRLGNLPAAGPAPELTHVTGTEKMRQAGAGIANLDAGDLVAGSTWWELEGVVWVESYIGFFWTPEAGAAVFEVPASLYFNDNAHVPLDISDNEVVVGGNVFFNTLRTFPFRWTREGGFGFLPLPAGTGWNGQAATVSRDGQIIGGGVNQGVFSAARAARWTGDRIDVFGPVGMASIVYAASDDGLLMAGEIGPDPTTLVATRWLDGIELGLDRIPGETGSSARFVSDDGGNVVGWATVRGADVLVRWAIDGTATVHPAPRGLALDSVAAINPDATAVVGALTDQVPFQENLVPYLWRLGEGFTLLGELGRPEDYDLSTALDVSDDGERVVGVIQARAVSNGDPPPIGFLWTRETGTQSLGALLEASGGGAHDIWYTRAISGDGRRILVTGIERPTIHDTTSAILELDLIPR